MAMSLEDLLTKEGFNRRMSKTMPRASSGTKARSGSIYRLQDPHMYVASSDTKKTERTKSDIPWHDLKSKHRLGSCDLSSDVKRISISSFDEFLSAEASQSNEIVEVGGQNNSRYNHIYSNRTYRNESGEDRSSTRSAEEAESKRQSFGKDTQATTKCLNRSSKKISEHPSFRDGYQKHMEQPETSCSRSTRSSVTNKSYDATTSPRKDEIEPAAIPALDEVAILAVISILSGPYKTFSPR